MQIKIRYFTSLREIVGKKEETLFLSISEEVTVGSVLKMLSEMYGSSFKEYVYKGSTGQPKSFLQFLVNGNSTTAQGGLTTELKDGDVLAILPPVGGG